ncbi:hypothetical protein V8C37DRAFT_96722 [Trichoderma ceciliae]
MKMNGIISLPARHVTVVFFYTFVFLARYAMISPANTFKHSHGDIGPILWRSSHFLSTSTSAARKWVRGTDCAMRIFVTLNKHHMIFFASWHLGDYGVAPLLWSFELRFTRICRLSRKLASGCHGLLSSYTTSTCDFSGGMHPRSLLSFLHSILHALYQTLNMRSHLKKPPKSDK